MNKNFIRMNYKTATLLIFVVLMLLTIYLMFSDSAYGLAIIGLIVPVFVVIQVFVVLTAKETSKQEYADGTYEFD
jgi:c-di-AMP phosphodiesterase-like protein